MKAVIVTDKNGVTHHYNPRYIKDVQEIKNDINNEWCVNLILTGEGEKICSILCNTKNELDSMVKEILTSMELE